MGKIVAENGKIVTDEMIADWEASLERDEWPEGWANVGEVIEGRLPSSLADPVTFSIRIPAAMKNAIDAEAKREGKTTSAYARGVLADHLMNAS